MTVFKAYTPWRAGLRRGKRLVDRSLYFTTEAPHFQVEVNEQWYVFCAIHKNASSTIRALVEAGSSKERSTDETNFHFLYLNHLVRSRAEIERARNVSLFVRRPFDRMVSCFQNKFIQRKGNRTIFLDYARVTGADPSLATFESFVHQYLRPCFGGGSVKSRHNRHIYTQQQQLLPVDYDIVARVDQFDDVMGTIGLGHLLGKHINSSSGSVTVPGASQIAAEELHARYQETGEVPDKASLLTLKDEINDLYRADLEAFGHLFKTEVA